MLRLVRHSSVPGAAMPTKRARPGEPSAAKAARRRSLPAAEQLEAIDRPDATELARAFGVDTNAVKRVRVQDQLLSLVDVTMLVTGNNSCYAATEIGTVRRRHPDVSNKIRHLKFSGRGQRPTPAGDIHAAVELIMLLPGRHAGLVRSEAARLFVRFYGGDPALAEQVIHNRERQEQLAQENPQHPARAFGRAVEENSAPVHPQQLQKACEEAVARTLIPAVTRVIDETFAAKIDEVAQQAAAAQAQWQQAALWQLDATLREMGRFSSRPVVNINTSARHEGDLDKVNVDPPETAEAAAPHVASSKRCSFGFSKIDILRRQKLLHLKGQLDKASNNQSHRFDIIQKCRLVFLKIPFA